jgi:NAD(P)-dependent dehydrogenase (short-subunit alcohol dehydrogenase family)
VARTPPRLRGGLVVVTGAGSGIGRATALRFAREGAQVALADVDLEGAERTAALARDLGVTARSYRVDVSDRVAMEAFAAHVHTELGVADVVVNNAGIGVAGPLLDTPVEVWERLIGVNLWGVIHGSRLFAAQMVARGRGGHVVNVASAAAFTPSRVLPAYATTKAAVLMLSECLRAELAVHGIGVTVVCPGLVNTPIVAATKYVGSYGDEGRGRRERAMRLYERRNYSPERVADRILSAVRCNQAVLPVTIEAHALRLVGRLAPGLSRTMARVDFPG